MGWLNSLHVGLPVKVGLILGGFETPFNNMILSINSYRVSKINVLNHVKEVHRNCYIDNVTNLHQEHKMYIEKTIRHTPQYSSSSENILKVFT